MMRRRMLGLTVLMAVPVACWLSLDREARGQPKPPSLEPVFGKGADASWTASGTFAIAPDNTLGRSVLTVGNTPAVLESKTPSTGARELRALVRLRTDLA